MRKYPVRRGFSVAAIAVVAIMLVTVTAFAAYRVGLLDFLKQERNALPEAEQLVETPNANASIPAVAPPTYANDTLDSSDTQTKYGEVNFAIREQIYDGKTLFLTVAVTPPDKETILTAENEYDTEQLIGYYFSGFGGSFGGGDTRTLGEYMEEHGYTKALHVNVGLDSFGSCSYFYNIEDDGTLIITIEAELSDNPQGGDYKVRCVTAEFNEDRVITAEAIKRTEIPFEYKTSGTNPVYVCDTPAEYPGAGITVDKVTVVSTSVSTYVTVDFTISDRVKFDALNGIVNFEVLDEKGNAIRSFGGSMIDNSVEVTLEADADLSNGLTLRAFAPFNEGARYETNTFVLDSNSN